MRTFYCLRCDWLDLPSDGDRARCIYGNRLMPGCIYAEKRMRPDSGMPG